MTEQQHFGRFALDGVLGVGGMGVVHTATDTRLGRRVALKLMSGPLAQHPEFRERFLREAAVLTRLDSPHVVQVYDHGDQDGTLWIATPFLAGGDLAALVRRRGPLPGALAAELCRQVADGLAAAHAAGVVHRDVKPANVLLRDAQATRLEAVVCDFGVASTGLGGLTATGAVAGTFEYLAPEYGEGAPPSPAGDVYALGCLLWACLTGRPPYTGSAVDVARGHRDGPLPRLVGRDPWVRRLNDVLARCLAKRPGDRFVDAVTARDALAEVARSAPASGPLAGPLQPAPSAPPLPPAPGPPTAGPPTAGPPTAGPRRRRGALAAGGAALVLVAGGLTALALTSGGDDDGPGSDAAESTTTLPRVEPAVRGDVTGDGLGDLVVRDWDPQPGRTVGLPSDGAGFGTPTVVLEDVFLPVTGDVDGDGAEEVVSVGVPSDTLTVTVTSLTADGQPDDSVEHEIPVAEGERDIGTPVLADLNGDGRADLVVTSVQGASGGRLAVWAALSTGDGFGELRPLFDEERRFEFVAAADVDGDGVDELVVVADDSLEVLTPDAEVTELATEGPTAINGYLFNPAVGDFDGDGAAEVAVVAGGANDAIALYRWDGTTWSDEFWLDEGGDAIDLSRPNPSTGVVDADGDGIDDLVRFQRAGDAGEDEDVVWLLRGGPDGFSAPERWAAYTCECDQFYDPTGSYAG